MATSTEPSVERVLVVPRNGYANRLQAWASSAGIATALQAKLTVVWEPEAIAPARAADLFDMAVLKETFTDGSAVSALTGLPHDLLPRHLTVLPKQSVVILAGHDRGEQAFMSELRDVLASTRARNLVIIAGGAFWLPSQERTAAAQRSAFYQDLPWSPLIRDRVAGLLTARPPYLGLHVRQTDRSREAPRARALRHALEEAAERTGCTSVFIAADTSRAREQWSTVAGELGLAPWTSGFVNLDRSQEVAGVDAMVDWIILGRAQAVIHTSTSSFGREAAVATGQEGAIRGCQASKPLQATRRVGELAMALATYPSRHWRRPA